MKIKIPTKEAGILKEEIFNAVKDQTLKTWVITVGESGNSYLTHKPDQWYDEAILKFSATNEELQINVDHWKGKPHNLAVDRYYLGRFIEVLLVHFSSYFETFEVHK